MKNNFFYKKQYSNIYKTTSRFSEVTSQIIYGEKFKILSKNKDWIKIKSLFDNYVGYIKNEKEVLVKGIIGSNSRNIHREKLIAI